MKHSTSLVKGFSLVEVLAAVAILGIMAFLAIPNIVQMKSDSETNLAIARAEAMNMGVASFVQANGRDAAGTAWSGATSEQRYNLVSPYLAFAPNSFNSYMPTNYGLALPTAVTTLKKCGLTKTEGGSSIAIDY